MRKIIIAPLRCDIFAPEILNKSEIKKFFYTILIRNKFMKNLFISLSIILLKNLRKKLFVSNTFCINKSVLHIYSEF